MRVVIVGCGRVGSTVAMTLAREGHQVTIVDHEARSFQRRLDPEFPGTKILGNAMDEDVLIRAGVEQADVLVTLTNGDNRNIMIAQVAREKFRVPLVLARIVDSLRAAAFRELGIETVDQTSIMTNHMRRAILGGANDEALAEASVRE
ncbi:MAG: TrkA family potassium uptake protein [Armatimonadetes bacterium]|nr:TrkA family potassium uptake protein [Armatimonadota bacterium]